MKRITITALGVMTIMIWMKINGEFEVGSGEFGVGSYKNNLKMQL